MLLIAVDNPAAAAVLLKYLLVIPMGFSSGAK